MKDIKETRLKINEIDEKMAKLFEERMSLAKDIAEYKKTCGLKIEDKDREREVVNKNLEFVNNQEYKDYYVDFIKSTMEISKNYQRKLLEGLKVGYAGIEGAYGYIATKKLFKNSEKLSYPSFDSAFKGVENGVIDLCVLPLENSYAGDVGMVMDLMFQGQLYINDIIELEVNHCLLVKKGTKFEDIKVLASHAQALAQCSDFIAKNNFKTMEYPNTAIAAKDLKDKLDNSVAVIASEETAEIYDLEVLRTNINTSRNNTTRFGVFSKTLNETKENSPYVHSIIMFTVKNEAGALAQTLNIIGSFGYNMRILRSRPLKELMWNYYFYIELDGNVNSKDGVDMIRQLKTVCELFKVVGTYSTESKV